jgi:hypothetical protein
MGNIIYSFSLDNRMHTDLIDLCDRSKNKSKLVRKALNDMKTLEAYIEYSTKLERLIKALREDNTIILPSFREIYIQCVENVNQK